MPAEPKRRRSERLAGMIAYTRVSTEEQANSGFGLAAQRALIQTACTARGWTVTAELTDDGLSGSTLNRPGLQEALALLEAGQAEGLVVSKLDRLSRSLLDFAGLTELARAQGWAVVALDLGVDMTTPAGEMLANVLASFAQYERRLIGERTRSALAVKKAQGVRLGRPRAIADDVMDLIQRRRAAGASLRTVARELNEAGISGGHGGIWHPGTVLQAERSRAEDLQTSA